MDDYMQATVETADGNVVIAGYTQGSWSAINDGWNDVVVVKLDVDDGEVIWTYQVRHTWRLTHSFPNFLQQDDS